MCNSSFRSPVPPSGLHRYCAHVVHINSCRHTRTIKISGEHGNTKFNFFFNKLKLNMMARIFNHSRGRHICAFKGNLASLVSSRTAKITKETPSQKIKIKNQKRKTNEIFTKLKKFSFLSVALKCLFILCSILVYFLGK